MQDETTCIPLIDTVLGQHISLFLKGLDGLRMPPSVQATQAPTNSPVARTAPKVGQTGGNDDFFHPLLGSIMNRNEHEILTKYLKLKHSVFLGFESEDEYEFILDCYGRLQKLGIDHKHGVEFIPFQLEGEPPVVERLYGVQIISLSPLTWTKFHALFLEKYVPRS